MFRVSKIGKKIFSGLEIEPGYVKLAQAKDLINTRKILRLIVKKVASPSENDLVLTLKELIRELKTPVGHLTVCIPRHKVTVRFLEFPTLDEKEIAGMVRLQSIKELPFSKEEIISDYLVTERRKEGYVQVALVIAHQDVINHYLDILKKANIESQRITFSTEAALSWYEKSWQESRVKDCSVLVDLDADNTDIAIFCNSHLVFTRGLSWGIAQLQGADSAKRLVKELRQTVQGYIRKKQPRKLERILFLQQKASSELTSLITQEMSIPCEIINPLKNLNYNKGASDIGRFQSEFSFLRVLGTVLNTKSKKLNLLPVKLRRSQELKIKKKRINTAIFLLTGIVLLSAAILFKKIHDKTMYIAYLTQRIKESAPLAKEAEGMLQKIELIERRSKIEASSVDVLRELHNIVPQNIALSVFYYEEGKRLITLQGVSANMAEIFTFIKVLEESAYFRNVQLKYVSEKKTKAQGIADFKIECTLEK